MHGASAFSVWSGDRPLIGWPKGVNLENPAMRAEVRLNGTEIGEICVSGKGTPDAEVMLKAQAGLVGKLAKMEHELKGMTERLIDTQDQMLAVYDLSEVTRNHLEMDLLLNQLAAKSTQLVSTESGFILLRYKNWSNLEHHPYSMLDEEMLLSCLDRISKTGTELLLNLSETEYKRVGLRNLLIIPIKIRDEICAALGLINKVDGDFNAPDIKLAKVIAEHAGARMEHLILYQESLEQARLQVEADLAQRVQLRLLPKTFPDVEKLDLWAKSLPASHVGGDFYDFVSHPGRPFTFAVGDVSGKGMPAALLMAMSRTVMRTQSNSNPTPTPEVIVDNCNSELYDDFTEVSMFATVFVGQFFPKENKLIYANAGHSPVIYCPANGEPVILEADGTALGVLPTSLAEDQTMSFNKNDVLVVATDGFSEASNQDEEFFGYDRLLQITKMLSSKSAQGIGEGLYETISHFSAGHPQDDDQTLIVIKGV